MPPLLLRHIFQAATDPTAPPLLLLHGTGGTEQDLLPLARKLSPGSAVLSPRGQVSEGGAARFFARLAEGVFDPAEVRARTLELADFVAAAAQYHQLELSRLIAIGFSNGANVAATLMLLRPETLAGAALFRPMVVLDQPATPGSLAGRNVLISSGNRDPIVPNDHPPRLAALLRAGGANITLQVHAAGHGLAPSDLDAAKAWFANSQPNP